MFDLLGHAKGVLGKITEVGLGFFQVTQIQNGQLHDHHGQ